MKNEEEVIALSSVIWLLLLTLVLGLSSVVAAAPDPKVVSKLTKEIIAYDATWTEDKTRALLEHAKNTTHAVLPIITEKGMLNIEIMGDTVLVNGKDISGNLGSKSTTGPNSPIIGDIQGSQVVTGNQSQATSYTLWFYVSIALALSLAVSLAFNLQKRKSRP